MSSHLPTVRAGNVGDRQTIAGLVDRDALAGLGVAADAEALTDGTTSLSWGQYADSVARLAGALVAAGVGRGDRVGVHLGKSVHSFVAVHGVIRSGAVMVPIDPLAPVDHVVSVLTDAGVHVLITDARQSVLEPLLARVDVRCLLLPRSTVPTRPDGPELVMGAHDIAASPPSAPDDVGSDDAAYIIYTSGSTGRPKGIVHTHRSAMAYAAAAAELYELSNLDRMTNIAPLHFDQSTFELYAAPLVGATVIVVPDPVLRFPASVADLIEAQRATVWYSVPHLLVQLTTRGVLERRDLTSLRWILVGGEAFPPGQLAELMEQIPSAQVSNVYGPAEVNQCTHHHVVEPPSGAEPVPIGRPWAAAEVRLVEPGSAGTVDPDRPVAAGDVGLVIVRTSTMMSGYWGREDLTAAAVVEQTDGGTLRRWYVTGDLAVHNAAGDLVFVGRVDNQIKLRGHRIELEAVDAAILEVDGVVAGTAVVDRPTGEEDRLVALIEIDPAFDPPDVSAAVRDELRRKLPRYSVPAEIRVVGRLPRTSTGKVDRVASAGLVRP